jgi:hypothetical protein
MKIRSVFGQDIPQTIQDYVAPFADKLVNWEYCKVSENGQIVEAHCKLCKSRIVGPRAWGDPQSRRAKDEANTILIMQFVRIMEYNVYAELFLEMADGSAHLTTACRRCANRVLEHQPLDTLQAMYAADIESLAETARTPRDMEVVEMMIVRTVTGVRDARPKAN